MSVERGFWEQFSKVFWRWKEKNIFAEAKPLTTNNNGHVSWKLPSQNICKKSERDWYQVSQKILGKCQLSLSNEYFFGQRKREKMENVQRSMTHLGITPSLFWNSISIEGFLGSWWSPSYGIIMTIRDDAVYHLRKNVPNQWLLHTVRIKDIPCVQRLKGQNIYFSDSLTTLDRTWKPTFMLGWLLKVSCLVSGDFMLLVWFVASGKMASISKQNTMGFNEKDLFEKVNLVLSKGLVVFCRATSGWENTSSFLYASNCLKPTSNEHLSFLGRH